MTFDELKESKDLNDINYFDLLNCNEWQIKRKEILERDNYECSICKSTKTQYTRIINDQKYFYHEIRGVVTESFKYKSLQIHHKLYIYNRLPWHYNEKYLQTLCSDCHEQFHNDESVEVWDQNELYKMEIGNCDRCSGKGYIKEYKKIQNGICFKCRGYGYNRRLINLLDL